MIEWCTTIRKVKEYLEEANAQRGGSKRLAWGIKVRLRGLTREIG